MGYFSRGGTYSGEADYRRFTTMDYNLDSYVGIVGVGVISGWVVERTDTPFWNYFCQISDSTTSYGSYSGAVPNEKITWGKLDIHTPKFIIESDATIVAPLIFGYLLGW